MKIPLHWPATADEGGVNDFVTTVQGSKMILKHLCLAVWPKMLGEIW